MLDLGMQNLESDNYCDSSAYMIWKKDKQLQVTMSPNSWGEIETLEMGSRKLKHFPED